LILNICGIFAGISIFHFTARKLKWIAASTSDAAKAKTNNNHTSTMATMATMASNYWTAMAIEAAGIPYQEEKKKQEYGYDDCGVKCRINTGNNEDDWQPCQPWCMTCGYPPHICDEYTTRCTGTKIGRWFNEEKGEWIEAEPLTAEEQEEEDRWNQHKYGLCHICKVGLDDKSEFTFKYANGGGNGIMMCWGCDEKLKQQQTQKRCTNCLNIVTDDDIQVSTWDSLTRQVEVIFCTKC
jgi:hypothetical protein